MAGADLSITLDHLRTLIVTVHTGSVSRAAEKLFLTQSATSQRLRQLEDALGVQLFVREPGRPLRITPAGEAVARFAEEVFSGLESLRRELSRVQPLEDAPPLVIALGPGAAKHILPPLLADLARRYPGSRALIQIPSAAIADEIARLVHSGEVELGIQMDCELIRRYRLQKVPLVNDFLGLVGPGSHPALMAGECSAEDVARYPLALPPRHSSIRAIVDRWATDHNVPLNVVMETTDLDALKEAVLRGLGLTVVPRFVVSDEVDDGRLAQVPISGMSPALPIYVVFDSARPLSRVAQEFVKMVREGPT